MPSAWGEASRGGRRFCKVPTKVPTKSPTVETPSERASLEVVDGYGSSGWTRTSNPPVNSVMQVFGLAGSRAGSSGETLLIPGVREKIGQRLARGLCSRAANILIPRRSRLALIMPAVACEGVRPSPHSRGLLLL
jgi:hypothetical protein